MSAGGDNAGAKKFRDARDAKIDRMREVRERKSSGASPVPPPAPAAPVVAPTLSAAGESHLAHFLATNEYLLFPLCIVIDLMPILIPCSDPGASAWPAESSERERSCTAAACRSVQLGHHCYCHVVVVTLLLRKCFSLSFSRMERLLFALVNR